MAETAAKATTTRPRARTAKPAATAAPKTTAPKAAAPAEDKQVRVSFTVPHAEETKRFAKFDLKYDTDGNETGCVGTVYAPLGTTEVAVRLTGPAEVVAAE